MTDWVATQTALTRAGYYTGKIDGADGPQTYTALFAFAAGRPADDTIRAIGSAAAKWLAQDGTAQKPARLAEFVAETGNESGGFRTFIENLNYAVDQLLELFSRDRISATQAHELGRKPGEPPLNAERQRAIANVIYGGAWGKANLGNTQPDDGWLYRGRGLLQLTGRANYRRYGAILTLPLEDEPDLAADPGDSLALAVAFWGAVHVNAAIDRGDFAGARKLTNGGSIGLEAVAARRARLLTVLA